MNLSAPFESTEARALTRREAIQRATLFLGVALSPSLLTSVMQAATPLGGVNAKPVYLSAQQFAIAGAVAW